MGAQHIMQACISGRALHDPLFSEGLLIGGLVDHARVAWALFRS